MHTHKLAVTWCCFSIYSDISKCMNMRHMQTKKTQIYLFIYIYLQSPICLIDLGKILYLNQTKNDDTKITIWTLHDITSELPCSTKSRSSDHWTLQQAKFATSPGSIPHIRPCGASGPQRLVDPWPPRFLLRCF